MWDLNPRPHAPKACALNQLGQSPKERTFSALIIYLVYLATAQPNSHYVAISSQFWFIIKAFFFGNTAIYVIANNFFYISGILPFFHIINFQNFDQFIYQADSYFIPTLGAFLKNIRYFFHGLFCFCGVRLHIISEDNGLVLNFCLIITVLPIKARYDKIATVETIIPFFMLKSLILVPRVRIPACQRLMARPTSPGRSPGGRA